MRNVYRKTMSGVTLLEIMLVLAIAGVVIAMSIRYFQSASASQRTTSAFAIIQGVVGAVESYRLTGKPLSGAGAGYIPYYPGGVPPTSPWTGGAVTVAPTEGSNTYTISMDAPTASCKDLETKLLANGFDTDCTTADTMVVTAKSE